MLANVADVAKDNKGKVGLVAGTIAVPAMLPLVGISAVGVTGFSIAARAVMLGAVFTTMIESEETRNSTEAALSTAVTASGDALGGIMMVEKVSDESSTTEGDDAATSTESLD